MPLEIFLQLAKEVRLHLLYPLVRDVLFMLIVVRWIDRRCNSPSGLITYAARPV